MLDSWIFDSFILADEPFTRASLVNNNLWGKLVSSLEFWTTFDERFRVTSVPYFTPDFNLLSCELRNFTFKVFESFYINIILKQNNTLTVPCEKSEMAYFDSSVIKNAAISIYICSKINLLYCFWIGI